MGSHSRDHHCFYPRPIRQRVEGPWDFQGRRAGSCLTLRNELLEETHVMTEQRLCWEGVPRQRAAEHGDPGGPLSAWLAGPGFKVMGSASGLSLDDHLAWLIFGPTQGLSSLCAHLSAKVDSSKKASGRLAGHADWSLLPLFGPALILSFRQQVPCRNLLL